MEADRVANELEKEEEEYVLLDFDSVYSQLDIPHNAPYVLSGLDTMSPILVIEDKFKFIGRWDETIGTCLLFKEQVECPVIHEETGPSEANLFAGKCIVDQTRSPTKQVKPLGRTHRVLKFKLAPDCGIHSTASAAAQTQQIDS